MLWSIYWWYISYERPAIHPKISQRERLYLKETIREESSVSAKTNIVINPPWLSIFTSMPVWSIIVANFCRSWSFYLLIDFQAKYFLEALNYNVGKVCEHNIFKMKKKTNNLIEYSGSILSCIASFNHGKYRAICWPIG